MIPLVLGLLAGTGCTALENSRRTETSSGSIRAGELAAARSQAEDQGGPGRVHPPQEEFVPAPEPRVPGETPAREEKEEDRASTEEAGGERSPSQDLIDSAMEFYQASSDFWEQGDLENALDALDKAYSLILQVDEESDPAILQQKEDLRITISRRIIEVYSSRFTVANGSYKAIPLDMNDEVEKALKLFKGRDRKFFIEAYRRSGIYRPMILEKLQEAGLPEELSWLPLIESGYKVRALSSARALGLWQFIASTGYKYGLKRDHWIDERMDPEKSTEAAIAYLKELHQIFGDWTTVLAAYNCGERRVLNRIKSQKIQYLDNFWDLYRRLPRETAFYVPKFLAVLHILNDPEEHGFDLPPVHVPRSFDEVTVSKQVHLKTIAEQIDSDYQLLREMNPELRQHLTPNDPYDLKVPAGKGPVLLAKLGEIPAWHPPVPTHVVHKVRRGETLSGIARRYGTSVQAIMAMNGLRSKHYVKAGWNLKVPSSGKATAVASQGAEGSMTRYVVRKGDSLWKIARRFSTTTRAIQSANNLRTTRLQIGQVLNVPAGIGTKASGDVKTYRVRRGDSPYIIAKRHRMELSEFLKVNRLTPTSTIYPGQIVKVSAR